MKLPLSERVDIVNRVPNNNHVTQIFLGIFKEAPNSFGLMTPTGVTEALSVCQEVTVSQGGITQPNNQYSLFACPEI